MTINKCCDINLIVHNFFALIFCKIAFELYCEKHIHLIHPLNVFISQFIMFASVI